MQILLRRLQTPPALQAYMHHRPSRRGQSLQLQAHLLSHLQLPLKVCHIDSAIQRQVRTAPHPPHRRQAQVPLRQPHKPPGQARMHHLP
jgi:hypothetical protein